MLFLALLVSNQIKSNKWKIPKKIPIMKSNFSPINSSLHCKMTAPKNINSLLHIKNYLEMEKKKIIWVFFHKELLPFFRAIVASVHNRIFNFSFDLNRFFSERFLNMNKLMRYWCLRPLSNNKYHEHDNFCLVLSNVIVRHNHFSSK